MSGVRSRSNSESSDSIMGGMCEVGEIKRGVSYDMDGKFSYSQVNEIVNCHICFLNTTLLQVVKCGLITQFKTTVDENGKFNYYSSDMRPVPPGLFHSISLKYL